jgi:hypothetical protein
MNTRTSLRTGILGTIAVGLLLVGCGGGGGGTPLTPSVYCAERAVAICKQPIVACSPGLEKTKCETDQAALCAAENAAVVAPRVFTVANVSKCVSTASNIFSHAGNDPITPAQLDTVVDACAYVYQGTVPDNMPCTVKYDCLTGRICDKSICHAEKKVNKGESCGNPGEVCNKGSYCLENSAHVFTCVAKAGAGEACGPTTPCLEDTLHCVSGLCAKRAVLGEDCATNDDCSTVETNGPTGKIEAAPYCNPFASWTCSKNLTFSPGSDSCTMFSPLPGSVAPPTGGAGASGSDAATD